MILQEPRVREITPATLLEFGTLVGLQNTFYRRRLFHLHQFDPTNKYSMDYKLLWELATEVPGRFFAFSERVASLNHQDGNLSHNNPAQAIEAAQVAIEYLQQLPPYQGPLWFQHLLNTG